MYDNMDRETRSFLIELINELIPYLYKEFGVDEIDSIDRFANNIATWSADGSGIWFMTVTINNQKTTLNYRDSTITINNWIAWKKTKVSLFDKDLYRKIVNGIKEVWDNRLENENGC